MAGIDIISKKLIVEVMTPMFNDRIKRRGATIAVVVKAMMPRENLEQIKPAAMNITADIASTAA